MNIYIISDTAGLAISEIVNFSLNFFDVEVDIHVKSEVRDLETLSSILNGIPKENIIIYHSFQDSKMSAYIDNFTKTYEIDAIDIMGFSVNSLSNILNQKVKKDAKFINAYNSDHFNRLEAVDFALKYDDGADFRGLKFCDIAIIGVSRSSKTPLSMYLASKGLKVSNVPLIIDSNPPRELFEINPQRIFGLTIDKDVLKKIRNERLKTLKLSTNSIYSSMDRIEAELKYAEELMKDLDATIIDVTYRSIEETSDIIINSLQKNNLLERKE
ncbi:pyruvate, water dikinase regulatory protein [Anaerococcus sp. AGMB09787]|uniref:pyruvate, water dikinase regulatory protein n=1 Tax=Anaerococcus sp. AGMB09787 TaxID=2922869 RepID=UPI001FAED78D|nr:pyruvate, water dikinase regulatory protein [Anaerococcus sp. AGMB09787]